MNENERLAKIETTVERIDKTVQEMYSWMIELNSRVVAREVLNGEFKGDIVDLQSKMKDIDKEIDVIKRAVWIGFGIIATLQFVIPALLQVWR